MYAARAAWSVSSQCCAQLDSCTLAVWLTSVLCFAGCRIDAYVGSGGGEWAGGDTDSDDDFCSPSEGSSGDDNGAGDYL